MIGTRWVVVACGVRSAHDYVVPARGKELVKTDLAIAIPLGTYARIAPRSGLAWKHSIDVGAGVRAPTRPAHKSASLAPSVRTAARLSGWESVGCGCR
jgi:hypothetical protein